MKILALDIATQTGFCDHESFGTWKLTAKKNEHKDIRLVKLFCEMREKLQWGEYDLVVYERAAGFHKNALIVESELIGVIKYVCQALDTPYEAISAKEIKKHVTGNGNAKKQDIMDAVIAKYNMMPNNYDEADAIAMYFCAMEKFVKNV